MTRPELYVITGCNAAGKSTFIRTRLNELEGFEVFMTDVYKGRTIGLIKKAIADSKNIIIETVFNDDTFKDVVDIARDAGYQTSLIVLFLDTIQQSFERVSFRGTQQGGITISGSNIKINFNENFKNVATYFLYFDRSDFIYTGIGDVNHLIMSFQRSRLVSYNSNNLDYPKKFADYSFRRERLSKANRDIIIANKDFIAEA